MSDAHIPASPTESGGRDLSPAETMAALSVSRRTLNRYVEQGRLTPRRLPSGHRRFAREDVSALLERVS